MPGTGQRFLMGPFSKGVRLSPWKREYIGVKKEGGLLETFTK